MLQSSAELVWLECKVEKWSVLAPLLPCSSVGQSLALTETESPHAHITKLKLKRTLMVVLQAVKQWTAGPELSAVPAHLVVVLLPRPLGRRRANQKNGCWRAGARGQK